MSSAITPQTDRFGAFGGRYVPETLVPALDELEAAYAAAMADESFIAELDSLLATYVGRPSPLSSAPRLSALRGFLRTEAGGAVVQQAAQHQADDARPAGHGGGAEQRVGRRAGPVLPRAAADQQVAAIGGRRATASPASQREAQV